MQQYPKVPEWVKDDIAWWIICDMCRRLSDLGGRRDDPVTWERLARSYGADVDSYNKPGGAAGRHLRQRGTVAYNSARNTWSQCKALCHGTVRYILWHWTPPRLASGADGRYYNDDPNRVCHQIAQRVDGVML